jgi:hypothetical protein
MDKKIAGIPHRNRRELPADRPCRMTCREEEMIGMNQIDQIKELQRQGYGPKEIATRMGIDRKTSTKYMIEDDWEIWSIVVDEKVREFPSCFGFSGV